MVSIRSARHRPPSVLVTSTAANSFVLDDVALLRAHFDVEHYVGSGIGGAIENFRRAMRADVTFCWFGSVYAFFAVMGARLARRRSVIMLGGVDVAREPELGYGIWRSRWKGMLLGSALRRADRVYAVDMSLRTTLERSSGRRWEKIEPLPTGYDPAFWSSDAAKEPVVLCVAGCDSMERVRIKGIDLLMAAAALLPAISFEVIGVARPITEMLGASIPPNVTLLPPIPRTQLPGLYGRARVFCQPSRREGLPNSLCEAMLCRCIPVGTEVGGIPTAIGEHGFVVKPEDATALAEGIAAAMAAPASLGDEAREHIARSFPRSRREAALVEIINRLAHA
jgi:glycosyltransferase involved in cell wall biosynthesis